MLPRPIEQRPLWRGCAQAARRDDGRAGPRPPQGSRRNPPACHLLEGLPCVDLRDSDVTFRSTRIEAAADWRPEQSSRFLSFQMAQVDPYTGAGIDV